MINVEEKKRGRKGNRLLAPLAELLLDEACLFDLGVEELL